MSASLRMFGSLWQCVRNLKLVGDSLDDLNKFANSEVELHRVGGVNAPVGRRHPVYNCLCC